MDQHRNILKPTNQKIKTFKLTHSKIYHQMQINPNDPPRAVTQTGNQAISKPQIYNTN